MLPKICHCKLIVKFICADCGHVMSCLLSSFPRSHTKLCFCLFSAPCIPHNASDKMLKCLASRHTITELVIVFSYLPGHIFYIDLV